MIPKFKIGDKVKTKQGHIFVIESMFVTQFDVEYSAQGEPCYYLENNLEIYTEPKPKVKKYKYVFDSVYTDDGLVVSSGWYENDNDFEKSNPFVKEFERLNKWCAQE